MIIIQTATQCLYLFNESQDVFGAVFIEFECVCKYFQLECRLAVNIFRAKIDDNFDFHKNAGVNLVEKNEFFTIKEREREKVVASPLHLIVGKYFEIKLKREQTWRGTECV